jgi:hypothetical protein
MSAPFGIQVTRNEMSGSPHFMIRVEQRCGGKAHNIGLPYVDVDAFRSQRAPQTVRVIRE